MQQFSDLIISISDTTKSSEKIIFLADFFKVADERDIIWTIALLSGRRPKRAVKTALLKKWSAEIADIEDWLFDECYQVAGDLADTIALILPPAKATSQKSVSDWIEFLEDIKLLEEGEKKQAISQAWNSLEKDSRFVFNKLLTGGFRIGISQKNMVKALAKAFDLEENTIAHRLMGNWNPKAISLNDLLFENSKEDDWSKPYPFYLAYALEFEPEELGKVSDWLIEKKWDGIRGQLIYRNKNNYLWSRGEELITEKFPEILIDDNVNKNFVIDGEILAFKDGKPLLFNDLQTRIGRKNLTKNILTKVPVVFVAYDILEYQQEDLRQKPIIERRKILESLIKDIQQPNILLSELITDKNWQELKSFRANARDYFCEGLMLKKKDATYKIGRKKGDWWKWKTEPLTIDAVLLYAMGGHGRRANLYTDYTFAVWDGQQLVPFAKAYSGLTDKEIKEVDSFVKKNTLEKFGPVRSVTPELVFELAFEGIAKSSRHKSGVALRFPRIKRWRKDKKVEEANTLEDLKSMLNHQN